jgi:cytochrome c5
MLLVMTRRAAFAIAIWAAGCPGFPKSGPPPGPLSLQAVQVAQVRFPTATAASLESGRQLFLHHCNACHKFPALGEYSDERWQRIVPRMAAKAKLSPADGDAILTFIQAARTASPMTAPAAIR